MELTTQEIQALKNLAQREIKTATETERLLLINEKNDELDAKLVAVNDKYSEDLEQLKDDPKARAEIIEEMTAEAKALKEAHVQEYAEVYADPELV